MGNVAHTAHVGGGVEVELLVFGVVVLFLAILLRPSQSGNARASVITLVVGVSLIIGSFTIPRM
jgi:hypothetical protein